MTPSRVYDWPVVATEAGPEPAEGPFKGFRLDLGVDNVTDEDYEVVAAGVSEEGINYKAALSWTHKW